eukprot:TRINITY_DN6754_c0_g1_i1.p1 TRINITY_DN6754_c0_g1~~TRINITY_DN6754_c0_g1_i1.p1  ORF type:complete len:193 (-),score=53.64 TRINITY_DN6754_c0_g1_i1:48-584(-)
MVPGMPGVAAEGAAADDVESPPPEASAGVLPRVQLPSMEKIAGRVTLTYSQRLWGAAISAVAGILLILLGAAFLLLFSPIGFALPYTLGNICLLTSTFFIMGPWNQLKKMCEPNRIVASVVFFLAIAFTLFSALYVGSSLLVILALFVQVCALVWYILSYIPGAPDCVKRTVVGMVRS